MKEDKKEISEQSALQRLAALCSRGEHSSGEILEKMRRWGLSEEAQARIMERLLRDRYVDDERFAHAFAAKAMTGHFGKSIVEMGFEGERLFDSGNARNFKKIRLAEFIIRKYRTYVRFYGQ